MDVTIVISTHNRAELLTKTLSHINVATQPSGCKFNILVIVNACSDHTETVLQRYRDEAPEHGWLTLEWIIESNKGKSHALNRGIPLLNSEVVAFVDDDHRVDQNYLTAICNAVHVYPHINLFCGRIIPDWVGDEPAWVHDKGPYRIYPLPVPRFDQGNESVEIKLDDNVVPGGGNLFLRREVCDRVGLFSTELGPKGHDLGGGEDSDFVLRALKAGERLQYVPDVVQYHYVDLARLRLRYLIRKSYYRSRVTSRLKAEPGGAVPAYMWRKLFDNLARGVFSLNFSQTRFYLVRIAATLGEIRGMLDARSRAAGST